MFALKNFIATSQHYFVAPMACEHAARTEMSTSGAPSYADQARSSRVEEAVMAVSTGLATLTYFTALASAV